MSAPLDILFEDADLLVVNKPAGLVCHPTKGDDWSSLIGRMRLHLGPGRPAHLINRLDRETSGVVVAAKNPAAAGMLGKIWEQRAVEKEYWAIVHGSMTEETGTIDLPLGKDESSIVAVKDCVRADGASAVTEFTVLRRFGRNGQPYTYIRLRPLTGRKHQIRIHLAFKGHPLVGDKLYGGDEEIYLALAQNRITPAQREAMILNNQALHAGALRLTWRSEAIEFFAPLRGDMSDFLEKD